MNYILILLVTFVLFGSVEPKKPKISIYMTTKNRACREFISKKVFPVYRDFRNRAIFEIIPWGRTSREKVRGTLSSQHGIDDLNGNKLMSCAFHAFGNNTNRKMLYVYCAMTNTVSSVRDLKNDCLKMINIPKKEIETCFKGPLGATLQREAELKTDKIILKYMPMIVLDDRADDDAQKVARLDFRRFVSEIVMVYKTRK